MQRHDAAPSSGPPPTPASPPPSLWHSTRRIAPLAWPVFLGQVAVLSFATVDTVLLGRYHALDLAALAIGMSAYATIFVGLMGVVLAVGPIAGQLYGAQRLAEAGHQLHQALWLALGLTLLGSAALAFPQPFLALAQAPPELAARVQPYLLALALALPAGLLFTAFRGFNTAVSRPKAVMVLQVAGLALKVPLSALLVFGWAPLGLPALGIVGCGIATAIVLWAQCLAAWWLMRRDPFYAPFHLHAPGRRLGLAPPQRESLRALLKLGVPMGLSIMIEVTGFTFMAFFIARIGTTPVAGHSIAMNLVSLMFMMPMALGNAAGTLVAQRIGAGDLPDARRIGWHGVELGVLVAAALGSLVYLGREAILHGYTTQPEVMAAALPLVAWVVLFHTADAAQCVAASVLRAWRIATVPVVIYALSLWLVGLGGGFVLAFDLPGAVPGWAQGARGFWVAATAGLVAAGAGLCLFLRWVLKQQHADEVRGDATAAPAG
jgi:MATE family multidrug resistance protein